MGIILMDKSAENAAADLDHAVGQMLLAADEDPEVFARGVSEIGECAPYTAKLLRAFMQRPKPAPARRWAVKMPDGSFATERHGNRTWTTVARTDADFVAMDEGGTVVEVDENGCEVKERDEMGLRAQRAEDAFAKLSADYQRLADEARCEEAASWMMRVIDPLQAALRSPSLPIRIDDGGATVDVDKVVDRACSAIRAARAPRPASSKTLLLTLRAVCEAAGVEQAEVLAEGVREDPLALIALLVDRLPDVRP